jgi:hypothetical protein
MTRQQLEHVLRASAAVADEREIVVIGSQSILGAVSNPPAELSKSMEADVYPRHAPEKSILIDGAIGADSLFHQTFGYYAHGVGPETAVLPQGWEDRLVRIESANTTGAIGFCLEPHDLAVSKLAAGRPQDLDFVRSMLHHRLVSPESLVERVGVTKLPRAIHSLVLGRLAGVRSETGV